MDESESKPWERWPGESAKAYQAFVLFRDLGPGRSLDQAGLIISPPRATAGAHQGRKRGTTGRVRAWAAQWDWAGRAAAWDAHQRGIYERAAETAIATRAAEWVRRRDRQLDDAWRVGSLLMKKAEALAGPEGADVAPGDLRAAAIVASRSHELLMGVVTSAFGIEASETPSAASRQEARDRAAIELEAWRAEQRAKLLKMLTHAPGTAPETAPDASSSESHQAQSAVERLARQGHAPRGGG